MLVSIRFYFKMTLIGWLLSNLLEPIILDVWQWLWPSITSTDVANSAFRLYSYSSTSILLWLYERLPHPLLLLMVVIGGCTVLGLIIIASTCGCRASWWIVRYPGGSLCWLVVKSALWIAKAVWRSAVRSHRLAYCIYQLHFAIRDSDTEAASATELTDTNSSIVNGDTSASSELSSVVSDVLVPQPIEAAAFRPRRNRVRSRRFDC